MKRVIVVAYLLASAGNVMAQDSLTQRQRKNTIKVDITSHVIFNNSYNLFYERVTKPNQSFVVSVGYQEFPKVTSFGQRVSVKDDLKRTGYRLGADYRFYLKKENKYSAPHGVYIGPYVVQHSLSNTRIIEFESDGVSELADLDTKFTIFSVGFQLGYQFVIHDRWAIDLSFVGPSISHYRYTLAIDSDFAFDKEDIQNEIILDLLDRFPFLDEAISDKKATASGRLDTWSYGYRYQLTLGYHFGRKNNK